MNKKNLLVFILVLIFVSSVGYAQHDKFFYYPYIGRSVLSRTQGSTWLALKEGQPVEVRPGDLINVEGSGKGEIAFPDGTSVRMKNNAMVTLSRYGINLRFGYVWLTVRRSADVFKVTTPMGTCSVLGTSFDVDVDKYGKANIRVFKGIVAVRASEDKRNKQLVLQSGMSTLLSNSTSVADKPGKFQHQSLEAAMEGEWEQRNFSGVVSGQGAAKNRPVIDYAAKNEGKGSLYEQSKSLPKIQSDENIETNFKAVEKILEKEPESVKKEERLKIIARQRSGFVEMLRQQQLGRDSIIGFSVKEKPQMMEKGHGMSFGESSSNPSSIGNQASLEREYFLIRNRLLRVQSLIRQKEMEISVLCSQNDPSTGNKLKIAQMQGNLSELRSENRILTSKLRELQHKKK